MLLNGLGATATGLTLGVVLVAKFTEGAWIMLLLVPALLLLFRSVRRHYDYVARETTYTLPLDLTDLRPPIVVVPIQRWSTLAHKGLRFALKLSSEVQAVQISSDESGNDLQDLWAEYVETPARAAGLTPPPLIVITSTYRQVLAPLLGYISALKIQHPDRQIAVVISELVEFRWYHYFLHNQRAEALKLLLLFYGDQRVVIINVP